MGSITGKSKEEMLKKALWVRVTCDRCWGYTAPEPLGQMAEDMRYERGSKKGPILRVESTKNYMQVEVPELALGPEATLWVNIWHKYNKDGLPVGVTFCRLFRGPEIEPQAAAMASSQAAAAAPAADPQADASATSAAAAAVQPATTLSKTLSKVSSCFCKC